MMGAISIPADGSNSHVAEAADSYDTDTLAYRSQCKAWCRQDLLLLSMIIVYYDFL